MIDSLPAWFAVPFGIVALIVWLAIEVRSAPTDPNPVWSRLDRLDGLDSRTD